MSIRRPQRPSRSTHSARVLRQSSRKGTAAVEFALCLVFVLMPLAGAILEWGWYFYREITLLNIVRDGTRLTIQDSVQSSRSAFAENWIGLRLEDVGLVNASGEVTVDCPSATVSAGGADFELMTIRATVPFDGMVSLLPFGNPPENLVATFTMRTPDCS